MARDVSGDTIRQLIGGIHNSGVAYEWVRGGISHPPLLITVYLTGVHLIVVQPTGVHLIDIRFTGVHLTGVHFIGVHLTGVYLIGVHLTGVHLTGVHLTGVHLIRLGGKYNPSSPAI
jgi:hypothetical protein